MKTGECCFCGKQVSKEEQHKSVTGFSVYHAKCLDEYKAEMQYQQEQEAIELQQDKENTSRILRRLKRTLKPKIWQGIEWETSDQSYGHLEIVSIDRVMGEKFTGRRHFGYQSAIRHVYRDISVDFCGDGYGGEVFLYIGKQRYLKMTVWG